MSRMKEIPELIKLLQHALTVQEFHGRFEYHLELVKHGAAAVEPLLSALDVGVLPKEVVRRLFEDIGQRLTADEKRHVCATAHHHAEQGQSVISRVVALEQLLKYSDSAPHSGLGLLAMARDVRVPTEVRCEALRVLTRVPLDTPGARALLELLKDADPQVAELALAAIEQHEDQVEHKTVKGLLMPLLAHPHGQLRSRAIDLLGHFGEVDVIEHVCAMPLPESHDLAAVQRMVGRMLSRPRSVLHISPSSFEHLVWRLLVAMEFEDVKVTGGVRDDGVDLTATRVESEGGFTQQRRRYIVQCKRHRDPIDRGPVEKFVETLRGHHAAHGLFIATSTFSAEARKASGAFRLRLVDRDELQALLNQHFGPTSYRIAA